MPYSVPAAFLKKTVYVRCLFFYSGESRPLVSGGRSCVLAGLGGNLICPCLCIFLPGKRRSLLGGCVLPSRTIAFRPLFAGNGLNTGGPNLPALFFFIRGGTAVRGRAGFPKQGKIFSKNKKIFLFTPNSRLFRGEKSKELINSINYPRNF